jgi:hypothetical protein
VTVPVVSRVTILRRAAVAMVGRVPPFRLRLPDLADPHTDRRSPERLRRQEALELRQPHLRGDGDETVDVVAV